MLFLFKPKTKKRSGYSGIEVIIQTINKIIDMILIIFKISACTPLFAYFS